MQSDLVNNSKTDIYIESCTLHDEDYLACHEIFTSTRSLDGADSSPSKSHSSAGGFSLDLKTDNRFILWKIIGNKLEIIEHSLTHKLAGNFKRIHFKDAMIIPKVHIYKHSDPDSHSSSSFTVHFLIATTSKLYRLVFKFNKNEHFTNSIFSSMSTMNFGNVEPINSYQINLSQVEFTDIFVNKRGEAYFAFVLPSNSICCVHFPVFNRSNQSNPQCVPIKFEINQPNIVKRLWSGITRSSQDSCGFESYKFFCQNDNLFFICLCRDFKLKLWCIKSNQCIHEEDLNRFFKSDMNVIWNESKIDAISLFDASSILTVVFSTSDQFKMCNLKLNISSSNMVTMNEVSKRTLNKNGDLISIQSTNFNTWIAYKNEREHVEIVSVPIYENQTGGRTPNEIQVLNVRSAELASLADDSMDELEENFVDEDFDDEKISEQILSQMDLKELYLRKIFEPLRYSRHVMLKSLGILGVNVNDAMALHLSNDEIKEKIIQSIEHAVQSHPNYGNVSEEEFLSLNMKFWSKYYTMLKQYDFDSRLPLGFFIEPKNESIILLIRKNSVSIYTRADLSQFYQTATIDSIRSFLPNAIKRDGNDSVDLLYLILSLRCIENSLKTNPNLNFLSQKELDLNTCCQFISDLTDYLTLSHDDFFSKFGSYFDKINNLNNLTNVIQSLLDFFNVNEDLAQLDMETHDDDLMDTDLNLLRITSELTIDSAIACFRDLAQKRFNFFKTLSVLLNIITKYYSKVGLSSNVANEIYQRFFQLSLTNLASYYYLKWLTDTYAYSVQSESIVKHLRRTSNIIEDIKCDQINYGKESNQLLVKLFLTSMNKFSIQTQSNYLEIINYTQLNEYLRNRILKYTWPMNLDDGLTWIKYLFLNIQYIHLINYCQCTKWNSASANLRSFVMGHCCLYLNKIDQSISFFLKASYNLEKDIYLRNLVKLGTNRKSNNAEQSMKTNAQLKNSRRSIIINRANVSATDASILDVMNTNENALLLDYYIKTIHYYDLNGNLEAAIELIQNALLTCQFDSKSKSNLYCILFKSYMDLEYFDKAYMSLMSNTDIEWKKICLKNFISELCNQNKTEVLVNFDYGDLLNEVFNILMSRARAIDLRTNDLYRVLFTLNVRSKNYRRAALSMYECYLRLQKQVHGINSLKRQEKCLLACLNVLKLVDRKFAWINLTDLDLPNFLSSIPNNPIQTKIVDLEEINKNYLLVSYTLKIFETSQNQNLMANQHTIEETTTLLSKNGYFDESLSLCFNMKYLDQSLVISILNILVDRCCDLNASEASDEKLSEDVMVEVELMKKNELLNQNISPYENPYSFKWKLLESYLSKLNDSFYYKHVCQRILTLGYKIPSSIEQNFKSQNIQGLIYVYLNYGLWNEAMDLIKDMIKNWSQSAGTVAMPFNLFDTLNKYCKTELNKDLDQSDVKKINAELHELINNYVYQIKLSSESYIKLKNK